MQYQKLEQHPKVDKILDQLSARLGNSIKLNQVCGGLDVGIEDGEIKKLRIIFGVYK